MNEKTKYQLMKNRELLKGYQRSDAGEEASADTHARCAVGGGRGVRLRGGRVEIRRAGVATGCGRSDGPRTEVMSGGVYSQV